MENGKYEKWYRYTVNHFNNMILDRDGFDIYEKYLFRGIDKMRPYAPDLCNTLEHMAKLMKKKRNSLLLSLTFMFLFYQFPFIFKLKRMAF
jgi:hypothetical protein